MLPTIVETECRPVFSGASKGDLSTSLTPDLSNLVERGSPVSIDLRHSSKSKLTTYNTCLPIVPRVRGSQSPLSRSDIGWDLNHGLSGS